jgi:ABC-type amino acid transport system permease subunit
VQVFFEYFGIPAFLDIRIPAETAGIIAISLNAGAYISEIFRAGIVSINKGQMEAARSLGLSKWLTMRLVILPQAIRRMTPAFVNQFIVSIKDTSLLSVIGINELTQSGEIIISANYRTFEIWGVVGIIYFIIIYALSRLCRVFERRYASQ